MSEGLRRHSNPCEAIHLLKRSKQSSRLPMKALNISPSIASVVVIVGSLLCVPSLLSQQIKIDTASARAVLKSLQDPDLTYEQAMAVAKLDGNQGMIREMRDLGEADMEEQFVRALLSASRNQPASDAAEKDYNFTAVKKAAPAIAMLLDQIEKGLEVDVRARIRPYTPHPDSVVLRA